MATRGVWQLKSLLIRYCEKAGSSAGVRFLTIPSRPPLPHICTPFRSCSLSLVGAAPLRDFLERRLVLFAKANPQIEICVSQRERAHPHVLAHYLEDGDKLLTLKNLSASQVSQRLHHLRDSRPVPLRKWDKPFRTTPSIQGPWQTSQALDRPHRTIRMS